VHRITVFTLILATSALLCAQAPSPQNFPPNRATVSSLPPPGQATLQGSVPPAGTAGPPLQLSLDEALRRGTEYNFGAISVQNSVRQARGQRLIELGALLPYAAGSLLVSDQQSSLAALGFTGFPGLQIPTILGPFHFFDARAGVSQDVLDITRLRNYRASQENLRAAELSAEDVRDLVVLAVTGSYLQVIASSARVDSTRAQVATAQATYQQASDRRAAGVAPRIDVTRSQVELQTVQQRLTSVQNDFAKQKIRLARVIGLPPGQDLVLTDALPYAPLTNLTLEEARARAWSVRPDLKSAEARVRAAEMERKAVAAERYPTAQVSVDYGVIGPSPDNSHGTFTLAGGVRVPIFQGTRVTGEIEKAEAVIQQRRAEVQDLRGRIDAEVREAFLDLTSAATQVTVAESNRGLAAETLEQARDRFAAGVADTVEVVQAQEAVAAAEQDYIAALFLHNLAKASLARAMGQAGQNVRQFLGKP